MKDFWRPRLKDDLIAWLIARYPAGKARLQGMRKDQLYAIYYKERARK